MHVFYDWLCRVEQHAASDHAELDLTGLGPGDLLRVGTKNTVYLLRLVDDDRFAEMTTDRADRPAGRVKIMGCTFGLSSTISPDRLFCGGSLEVNLMQDGVRMTHTTSAIRTIQWVRHGE